jgi:hypothetical protein
VIETEASAAPIHAFVKRDTATGRFLPAPGAVRKPAKLKLTEARDVVAAAAAIYELVGQSSVELGLDSKGQIKPSVKVYHRDPKMAAKMAQELFDEQLDKYVFKPVAGA